MGSVVAWLEQPTTIMGVGIVVGAVVYWVTGNVSLTAAAVGLVLGGMNDHTKDLLAKVEALEDAAKGAGK